MGKEETAYPGDNTNDVAGIHLLCYIGDDHRENRKVIIQWASSTIPRKMKRT